MAAPMNLNEQLRDAALREALAPMALAQILAGLETSNARLRVLRSMKHLVQADQEEPGILDRYVHGGEEGDS